MTDKGSNGKKLGLPVEHAQIDTQDLTRGPDLSRDPLRSPAFSASPEVPSTFKTLEEAQAHIASGAPLRCHVTGKLLGDQCLGFFDAASDEDLERLQKVLAEYPRDD